MIKYNPEYNALKAEAALDVVSKQEYNSWLQHPCTKVLKYNLESSLDKEVLQWVRGNLTDSTIEGSFQLQSRALGRTEAIEGIMSYIDEMLDYKTQREEELDDQIRDYT